ncbi:glycosyltransferase [Clostridium perfringens]|uniref:glycosyltransferase n=1 Tax=Clostridium perfringens TaxID=1502 RepID=UPI002AC6F37D|nr:glycosyltransferase [Clostridium perfringens]MDZ5065935.1 glycosyltransferase [Clostridium perfringens]
MYVLMVPSWYENNTQPTLGSFFREQAEGLVRKGVKVVIAYPGFNGLKTFGKNNIKRCKYEKNGVYIYRFDTYNYLFDKLPYDVKQRYFKKKLFSLYKEILIDHGKPDIIQAHSAILAGYGCTELGKTYDIPVVITEHSSAFLQNNFKKDTLKLIKKSLKNSDLILAVSNGLKKYIKEYTNKNIDVIPNMVDTDIFIPKLSKCNNKKFKFITVCYLNDNKGLDILIKAFAEKFNNNDNVELAIGGDGLLLDSLKELSICLGVRDKVKFLGALKRNEVVQEMNNSHCFVLPSRYETFGVVLIEALSCGLPLISTKTSGPSEIINEKNGILVEVDNVKELANAMYDVYINYSRYIKNDIRKECVEKYSVNIILDKLIDNYTAVLRKDE